MDLDVIKTFLTLTKLKNFTRSAEALFISQTTVTARIKALENELGRELFIRDSRNIKLTPAGEIFLDYAMKVHNLMYECKNTLKCLYEYKRQITIAAPDSVWRYRLLTLLDEYMDVHKDTAFNFSCAHSEYIIQDILNDIIDIGITFTKPFYTDLEAIPYFRNYFHLVGKQKYVQPQTFITPNNIHEFPVIFMPWGPEFCEWYNKYYENSINFLEVEGTSLFIDLLLMGKGIGFLPDRCALPFIESGDLVDIIYEHKEKIPIDYAYIVFLKKNTEKVSLIVECLLNQKS